MTPSRRRLLLAGSAAVAAAAGAGGYVWRERRFEAATGGVWSLVLPTPGGGELPFAGLRGRPLVLNFWATWCAPCIKELPLLDRFQREQAGRRQVVGLAVDSPTPVREFLLRQPLGFPVGLAGLSGVDLARSLGNSAGGLPFSVLIDGKGQARERKLGALTEEDLARWGGLA
jgi:thiol-disulfide isomerase/thioredoxin